MARLKTLKFVRLTIKNEDGKLGSYTEFCEQACFVGGLLRLYGCHKKGFPDTYDVHIAIADIVSFELHNCKVDIDTMDFAL